MPQFQKAEYHPDITQKRPLTADDVQFLKNLQKELNTQDNMGNRDPRFWVVRQNETRPTAEDYADDTIAMSAFDSSEQYCSLEEFADYIEEQYDNINITRLDDGYLFTLENEEGKDDPEEETIETIVDAVECLQNWGIDDFEIGYVLTEPVTVPDTLFLTHKDCEDYLRTYHYNHPADAHAYAMTAVRSPRYEQLITLLQVMDCDQLLSSINNPVTKQQEPLCSCGFLLSKTVISLLLIEKDRENGHISQELQNLMAQPDTNLFYEKAGTLSLPGISKDRVEEAIDWLEKKATRPNIGIDINEASEPTVEVTALFPHKLKSDEPVCVKDPLLPENRILWIVPSKSLSFTEAAYPDAESMLEEFRQTMGICFPEDFPWWQHLVSIYGTYIR